VSIVNENEKNINTILAAHYLKTNANFTLDERNRIENIAYQCPREGGASVYRARTLMNAINPYAIYNDDVQCNAIMARKGSVTNSNIQQLFLKPNKLGNELKFESNINLEGNFQIKVFDVLGKELLERRIQVNSSTFTLPFNFAVNSVYLITVASNNHPSVNFKLIW
jgi:hypothetical protein